MFEMLRPLFHTEYELTKDVFVDRSRNVKSLFQSHRLGLSIIQNGSTAVTGGLMTNTKGAIE